MLTMYIKLSLFIAQSNTQEFIEKNRNFSELLANSFDRVWEQVLYSELFTKAAFYGAIFAVAALGIFAIQWLEYQSGNRGYLDWSSTIVPTILVGLLSKPNNQPVSLAEILLWWREIGNGMSDELLNLLSKDLTVSQAADVAGVKTMLQLIASDAVNTCSSIGDKALRNDCFNGASQQIKFIVSQHDRLFVDNWATKLGRELLRKIQDAQGADYASSQYFGRLFGDFGTSFQGANSFAVPMAFISLGTAFYWGLEIVTLIAALATPLIMGTSLFAIGHGPILNHLIFFFKVWLTRLYYALIIGLTGLMMAMTPSSSTLIFPLIAGFLGPLIAFWLAFKGSGGLFSTLTGAGALALGRR